MTANSVSAALAAALEQSDEWRKFDAGMVLSDVMGDVAPRYACDVPEHCSARPAWDVARDVLWERLAASLDDAVLGVFLAIAPEIERYAADYPDAPLNLVTKS